MCSLCPKFNAHRMLEEYTTNFYIPALHYWQNLTQENMKGAKELSQWKTKIMTNWEKVSIIGIEPVGNIEIPMGEELKITALVHLGEITPEEVKVEIYYGQLSISGELKKRKTILMKPVLQERKGVYRFEGNFRCQDTGRFGYKIKITPYHPYLVPSYYLLGFLVIWG